MRESVCVSLLKTPTTTAALLPDLGALSLELAEFETMRWSASVALRHEQLTSPLLRAAWDLSGAHAHHVDQSHDADDDDDVGTKIDHRARLLQALKPWARNFHHIVASSSTSMLPTTSRSTSDQDLFGARAHASMPLPRVPSPPPATVSTSPPSTVIATRSGGANDEAIVVRDGVRALQQRAPPLVVLDSLSKLFLIFGRGADAAQLVSACRRSRVGRWLVDTRARAQLAHVMPLWFELVPRASAASLVRRRVVCVCMSVVLTDVPAMFAVCGAQWRL